MLSGKDLPGEDAPAWRDELAARVNRYRARRKPRPPRYPSLRLHFEPGESFADFPSSQDNSARDTPAAFDNLSHRALALDGLSAVGSPTHRAEVAAAQPLPLETATSPPGPIPPLAPSRAKIIEFPRSATAELPLLDELAEPVMERPRILEAPEIALPDRKSVV